MQRWTRSILIAMITGLLLGAAVPAQATQVPFDVDQPIFRGFTLPIKESDRGSGFVGGCDVQLQCVGASVRVANTGGEVEVGGASVRLTGSICLMDAADPCGTPGDPGTGFVFTRRDVLVGPSGAEIPDFELELCIWEQDPRDAPSKCTTFPVNAELLAVRTGMASLGDVVPERVIVGSFSN